MATQQFTVPMIGKISDWSTFSGDSSDHVRPMGILQFKQDTAELGLMTQRVISYDVDAGTVLIEVEATPAVLGRITAWLAQYADLDDMAAQHLIPILRRDPAVDPKPDARFTTLRGIRPSP